ncbi:MAG: dTDP-4-dehydrorhamnose 3,5-epimerase, partial [Sphingobacterium sp.]
TKLKDCFIIEPKIITDARGYFFEGYNQLTFEQQTGLNVHFVQDNQSFSTKNVLRGLHAQKGKYAQAKLVRVLQGEVLDVAVDARVNSPTFGQHVAVNLSADNKKQLFVPRGFLHGFVVLSNSAEFLYKCDNFYKKDAEWGVIYNDPSLNIDWGAENDFFLIADKDKELPSFELAINKL